MTMIDRLKDLVYDFLTLRSQVGELRNENAHLKSRVTRLEHSMTECAETIKTMSDCFLSFQNMIGSVEAALLGDPLPLVDPNDSQPMVPAAMAPDRKKMN
jgi:hypothetical protein